MRSITVAYTFDVTDVDALHAAAKQIDDENMGQHQATYTDEQALAVVFNNSDVSSPLIIGWSPAEDMHWGALEDADESDNPTDKEN